MSARQPIISLKPFAFVCSEGRRLVSSLVMAVLVTTASLATLRAQGEIRIPHHAFMPPDFPASVNSAIPKPRYVPAGYELWRIYKNPADGFRTERSQVEVEYRDPGCWDRKANCSLQVFFSPMTGRPFSGTTGRAPESLSLRIGKRTVQARYFAEMGSEWPESGTTLLKGEAQLEHGKYNALVFPLDDFMIGIRADSETRLGRSELIKVAQSLTYKAR